jgi:hypothetical protein
VITPTVIRGVGVHFTFKSQRSPGESGCGLRGSFMSDDALSDKVVPFNAASSPLSAESPKFFDSKTLSQLKAPGTRSTCGSPHCAPSLWTRTNSAAEAAPAPSFSYFRRSAQMASRSS